jgi:DNA-binding cell septation regulator SpoVG
MHPPAITEVRIRLADPNSHDIVGFASCLLNGELHLNDLMLFREPDGEIVVRYPIRKTQSGKKYTTFFPVRPELSKAIESAVRSAFVSVCSR